MNSHFSLGLRVFILSGIALCVVGCRDPQVKKLWDEWVTIMDKKEALGSRGSHHEIELAIQAQDILIEIVEADIDATFPDIPHVDEWIASVGDSVREAVLVKEELIIAAYRYVRDSAKHNGNWKGP